MTDVQYKIIGPEAAGQRLDNFLIKILKGVPKSHIYRIIRGGEVRVNKKRAKQDTRLQEGDSVRIPPIRMSEEKKIFVGQELMEKLKASIIFEDASFLVVNKPSGIAVHGGSGLSLGIIEAFREIRQDLHYLELAHRLDRETSGCLVLAKKRSALRALQALFSSREVSKTYWAILDKPWTREKKVKVDASLEKNTLKSGERMVRVQEEGKPSETLFSVLEKYKDACWIEALPKTGRTHQIRVHAASLGHSIIGDSKYGERVKIEGILAKDKLYLHARAIQFNLNGVPYAFQADLDPVFKEALKLLRARSA